VTSLVSFPSSTPPAGECPKNWVRFLPGQSTSRPSPRWSDTRAPAFPRICSGSIYASFFRQNRVSLLYKTKASRFSFLFAFFRSSTSTKHSLPPVVFDSLASRRFLPHLSPRLGASAPALCTIPFLCLYFVILCLAPPGIPGIPVLVLSRQNFCMVHRCRLPLFHSDSLSSPSPPRFFCPSPSRVFLTVFSLFVFACLCSTLCFLSPCSEFYIFYVF